MRPFVVYLVALIVSVNWNRTCPSESPKRRLMSGCFWLRAWARASTCCVNSGRHWPASTDTRSLSSLLVTSALPYKCAWWQTQILLSFGARKSFTPNNAGSRQNALNWRDFYRWFEWLRHSFVTFSGSVERRRQKPESRLLPCEGCFMPVTVAVHLSPVKPHLLLPFKGLTLATPFPQPCANKPNTSNILYRVTRCYSRSPQARVKLRSVLRELDSVLLHSLQLWLWHQQMSFPNQQARTRQM